MIVITTARPDEFAAAADVLAEAFVDDPVARGIVPFEADRRRRLAHLFTAVLRSGPGPRGVIDLARREGDERIVGVAAWEAPGSRRGALGRELAQLPLFLKAFGPAGLPRAMMMEHRLQRHRPTVPHWYLADIGVSVSARGLGVGSALLRARLDAVDQAGLPAYLESSTPENRRLYARFGFGELASIAGIPGASPVAMLRSSPPDPGGLG
ncbi:GNAT family N-acetyltransferase [Glycomyces terrestris]|uniref:GNAT family N-acetyltransferase n=1 Tax=Glycomyces terrestris TaxID=2493553 RepID=A0A426UVW4_9ACTN|nr:GNAT family N-acetyltransferase [Glycomyces terrestris]RRR98452.1 GNAT family N-acetyltransferase [Glycomyces terrestris]